MIHRNLSRLLLTTPRCNRSRLCLISRYIDRQVEGTLGSPLPLMQFPIGRHTNQLRMHPRDLDELNGLAILVGPVFQLVAKQKLLSLLILLLLTGRTAVGIYVAVAMVTTAAGTVMMRARG